MQNWNMAARVAVFGASFILAAAISTGAIELPGFYALSTAIAYAASFALGMLGVPLSQDGAIINAGSFVAVVATQCTAIELMLLVSAATLVWPASPRAKAVALLLLLPAIVTLNLVRVVTLMLTGIGYPEHFDTLHVRVWQPAMVLAAAAMWLLWERWAWKHMHPGEVADPPQ